VLLWLWCRLAATALIGSLAWEPPCAAGAALEKAKRQEKKKKTSRYFPSSLPLFLPSFLPFFSGHICSIWKLPCQELNWSCSWGLHHSHSHSHSHSGSERHICNLCTSLRQRWLLNSQRPGIEPASSLRQRQVLNPLSHNRNHPGLPGSFIMKEIPSSLSLDDAEIIHYSS